MLTDWAEDGHASIVYLYLSCVGAKNTRQSLLRYVGRHCNIALKSAMDARDVL